MKHKTTKRSEKHNMKNTKNKSAKNTKNATKPTQDGPGRPRFQPRIPQGKFTIVKFCELNEVNPDTGKGPKCSKLTLINFLNRDAKLKGKSLVVKLDAKAEPEGEKGLGRKAFVYCRRDKAETLSTKSATKSKPSAKAKAVSVDVGSDYEATKAALLAPTPAVDITPAPEPEVAPAVDTAPVSETVTAPADAETVTA